MLLALIAHTGWGIQTVLARYLQTVSHLPSMSILAMGYLLATTILFPTFLPYLRFHYFRSRTLWLFALIVALRGTTNLLSTRFTLAIYVQVIMLMTPFLVAILSLIILKEQLPRYTGRAVTIASLGALMMIGGNVDLSRGLTSSDWIGLILASFSTFFLAIYMILVRRTRHNDTPKQIVLMIQCITLLGFSMVVSLLIGEDWLRWTEIGRADWLAFLALTILTFVGANLSQITAIQHLGASLVGTLLPWRLVVALIFAPFIVGEYLTSIWQVAGAVIVLATISWYLLQQSNESNP
jgi:drug/metabolite transporter (DMT)-like permease